ncbi:MAG: TerC family protein [Bacteroidetes bacterium]|nr:TerC family protein [Bacteroidota bacterium]
MDFSVFSDSAAWVSLLTLTFLEVVLGIDNIIFISIISNRLPESQQKRVRNYGLLLAMAFRLLLLLSITWILGFTEPLVQIPPIQGFDLLKLGLSISIKDLILMVGGLFLIAKSTTEIFHKMEGQEEARKAINAGKGMAMILAQIVMIDLVFSFDSILTAVGLTPWVEVMMVAVVISIFVMMVFAGAISRFINKNPSLQMLALSFLILIGFLLILEGFHVDVPKGYLYFGVLYALSIELLNMRRRRRAKGDEAEK